MAISATIAGMQTGPVSFRSRVAWSIAAVLLGVLATTGWLDAVGRDHAEQALTRALVTFAVARGLNGVISVAQGTEVAVEPAGVGVIFTLGQILDPINDLVERFSTVMLVATSSLGLQNLLLRITGWWGTTVFVIAAAALALIALWWPRRKQTATDGEAPREVPDAQTPIRPRSLATLAIRLLLIAVFLRFAVPLLIISTTLIFDTFLAAEQEAAVRALETTTEEIEEAQQEVQPPPVTDGSVLDRLSGWIDRSLDSLDVRERLERLGDRVSRATEHIINLIVIFVLQTILLPLFFLWLIVEALKAIAKRATGIGG